MRATKSSAGERMVDGGQLRPLAAFAARWGSLGIGLVVGFRLVAQEPGTPAQTNDVVAGEGAARIGEMVQSAESSQPEEATVPEDSTTTDGLVQTNGSAKSEVRPGSSNRFGIPGQPRNDERRSRGKRSLRSRSNQGSGIGSASDSSQGSDRAQSNASPGTNGSLAKLDYSNFKIIVDRNIFDPNRIPHRPGQAPRPAPKSFDALTLVGIMNYDKGTFAFFDGTSSEYQKALKLTDVIAGYKVTNIAPTGVTLAAGTNQLELKVGMQMRREENGPWFLAGQPRSYVSTSSSASTDAVAASATTASDAASSSAENEIIKRLKQQREQQ